MKEAWNKFEVWLKSNFSAAYQDLNDPIKESEIAALEAITSIKLPEEFISFLKVHNGQSGDSGWIIGGSELLSSERIIEEWTVWNDLLQSGNFKGYEEDRSNGVKSDWWNPKWIPFTYDGGGNHLCIDLDPSENGTHGQVITMWHDDGEREVKAKSFGAWFSQYVQDVESGKYVYLDEAIVDIDDV